MLFESPDFELMNAGPPPGVHRENLAYTAHDEAGIKKIHAI